MRGPLAYRLAMWRPSKAALASRNVAIDLKAGERRVEAAANCAQSCHHMTRAAPTVAYAAPPTGP